MLNVAIRILEGLFALGAIGSGVVIILTTIDDVKMLFNKEGQSAPIPGAVRPDAGAVPQGAGLATR